MPDTIFSRQTMKNAIKGRLGTESREIMQSNQDMFETKLDRARHPEMTGILNAIFACHRND